MMDYCLHVGGNTDLTDLDGRKWWMEKRQGMDNDDENIRNLNMFDMTSAGPG